MTEQEIREALPHLASVEPIGNPPFMFRVTTEPGYYIKLPTFDELMYKTVTGIYPGDDLSLIQIVAEADLPEGAEINGDTNPPVTQ